MVRAAKTRAGTPAAGLSPKSAPLSRKDTEHMALKDIIKSLVNETIEEMAGSDNEDKNSENDNKNNEGKADEGKADEGKKDEESGEAGTKGNSTLNFSDEDFKKELKTIIKKEVRDVAGDMLNRTPSNGQPNNGVDVDAVFAGLLGFETQKKG